MPDPQILCRGAVKLRIPDGRYRGKWYSNIVELVGPDLAIRSFEVDQARPNPIDGPYFLYVSVLVAEGQAVVYPEDGAP